MVTSKNIIERLIVFLTRLHDNADPVNDIRRFLSEKDVKKGAHGGPNYDLRLGSFIDPGIYLLLLLSLPHGCCHGVY